jgi:sugar/nucleoside kinase (ribokinase family)
VPSAPNEGVTTTIFTLPGGNAFNAGLIKALMQSNGDALSDRIGSDNEFLLTEMIYASACGAAAVTEYGCCVGVSEERVARLIAGQGDAVRSGVVVVPLKFG